VRPSADDSVSERETIFECLPAMWHYQAAQLAEPVATMESMSCDQANAVGGEAANV